MGLVAPGMWKLNSPTSDWTHITCIIKWILNHWTTREVPGFHFSIACWSWERCHIRDMGAEVQREGLAQGHSALSSNSHMQLGGDVTAFLQESQALFQRCNWRL